MLANRDRYKCLACRTSVTGTRNSENFDYRSTVWRRVILTCEFTTSTAYRLYTSRVRLINVDGLAYKYTAFTTLPCLSASNTGSLVGILVKNGVSSHASLNSG